MGNASLLVNRIISSLPVAVWAAGGKELDYAITLWSEGAERLYGYSAEQMLGKNYIDAFVHPQEKRQAIRDHEHYRRSGEPYRNLARDFVAGRHNRLLLTQGVSLWDPAIKAFVQGEVSVDVTEVPAKDAQWLESVLTPEVLGEVIGRFSDQLDLAFAPVDQFFASADSLFRTLLGDDSRLIVFLEDEQHSLRRVYISEDLDTERLKQGVEFDVATLARWMRNSLRSDPADDARRQIDPLIVDQTRRSIPNVSGRHRFPTSRDRSATPAPFALTTLRNADQHILGVIFLYLERSNELDEMAAGLLKAVAGIERTALELGARERKKNLEVMLAAEKRERDATHRMARQYRHQVMKLAKILNLKAALFIEMPHTIEPSKVGVELESIAEQLSRAGVSFQLEPKDFFLYDVLASVTGYIIDQHPGVRVERRNIDTEAVVRGVEAFFEGALENLLLNAVEAQRWSGRIGVEVAGVLPRTNRLPERVVIHICDDGPGMPFELVKNWGVEGVSTRGADRGLGLFIARQSIAEMGGTLTLVGQPGWAGACWEVCLPCVQKDEEC